MPELISRKEAKGLGRRRYFTGEPCPYGHVAERYVDGGCVPCKISASSGKTRRRRNKHGKRYKETPTGTITSLLAAAKQRSAKKSHEFDLTREWVSQRVEKGTCEVTGLPFVLDLNEGAARNPWRPSIDKIDPTKGYTKDNCRMVVSLYNFAKNEFSDDDVLAMARALTEKCRTPP